MAMHAIPTKMDAVTEKMVRRDMIAILSFPDWRKSEFPCSPDMILEQVALGSRNLVARVMHCAIASLI
jgi:hypothetical protein